MLGERGAGWYNLLATLNNERIVCAAICVGLAQGCLEEANQYATEREAFGKPIGQYQAIQHQLADMATEIELSRLITYKAAWMQANNPKDPSVGVIASMAKMYTSDAAFRCTDRAMRILAGYGFTMEYHIQRYYRDIRQLVFAPITNEMSRNYHRPGHAGTEQVLLMTHHRSPASCGRPVFCLIPHSSFHAADRRCSFTRQIPHRCCMQH